MRTARMNWKCAAVLCVAVMASAGCFVRRRVVAPPGQAPKGPVLVATKDQLLARLRGFSESIQSFNMKADMSPSVGSVNGGELTDYATIRAYILFRKPDEIRVLGLDPVVHSTTIFDMVSNMFSPANILP